MEQILDILNSRFVYNGKQVIMAVDENNDPWFKAKDVALILEYRDTDDAIRKHVDTEDKVAFNALNNPGKTPGSENTHPQAIFINESGLYSLILSSKQEVAKIFKKWVTKEVLPSIRKYGEYKLKEEYKNQLAVLMQKLEIKDAERKALVPLATPLPLKTSKNNCLLIIDKHEPNEKYKYYVIRAQRQQVKQAVKKVSRRYPDCEIVYEKYDDPNSVRLYVLMKEQLKISYSGNHFNIPFTPDLLREVIELLYKKLLG